MLRSNFSSAPRYSTFFGSAQLNLGATPFSNLLLTSFPGDVGSLAVSTPPDSALPASFNALFRWQFPERQPYGLSFIFGPNVSSSFGVEGGGTGLRLSFLKRGRERDSPTLRVTFEEVIFIEVELPTLRLLSLMDVNVAYEELLGLRVAVDNALIVDRLRLIPWAPSASWSFGFGATANDPYVHVHAHARLSH